MPRPEVVAVVVLVVGASSRTEEVPVALCVLRLLVVVSGRRSGAILEFSPRGRVAVAEVGRRPALVGVVSERQDGRMRILGEDARGRLVALVVTLGDVSRREHGHSRLLLARAASLPARRCGRLRGAGFASLRAGAEIDVERALPRRQVRKDEAQAETREDGHDRDPWPAPHGAPSVFLALAAQCYG